MPHEAQAQNQYQNRNQNGAVTRLPAGSNWCNPTQQPLVAVKTDTDKIKWVFNRSEKLLNGQHIDTVNPYGNEVITDVGGLMQGGIRMAQVMQFGTLTNNNTNEMCMFYTKVEVSFHIYPTIFIASEYPPGSCMHNAIKAHELTHINVDRDIVNRYAKGIGEALRAEVQRAGVYGPFPSSRHTQVQQEIKARMENVLKTYSNAMDAERRKLQQQVDNINEYERVNHLCDKKL